MNKPTSNIRFTLKQIQYFISVARTGQISQAALESHVSQSAMTAAIAELERGLDTLLFERERSGVTLTYEGNLFLRHAERIAEAAEDAARHPFREQSQVRGTLEVAASYTVLGYFLLPYIAKFQKLHPNARIVPVEKSRRDIESALTKGHVDLAVALTSHLSDSRAFRMVTLARSRRQLWVSESNPLARLGQVSLEEAAAYPYVIPMVDEGDLSAMQYWRDEGAEPASFIQTSSMEAVREMVALDLGVTILSDMVYRPWSLEGRRIQAVPLQNPVPTMEVGLMWLKGHRLSPLAEAFRKYLKVAVGDRTPD